MHMWNGTLICTNIVSQYCGGPKLVNSGPAATRLLAFVSGHYTAQRYCDWHLTSKSQLTSKSHWRQKHCSNCDFLHSYPTLKLPHHTWTQFNMTYCSSLPCLILEHLSHLPSAVDLTRVTESNTFNTTLLFLHTRCSITYRVTHFMTIHNTITLYIFTHSLIWLTVWLNFHNGNFTFTSQDTISMHVVPIPCRQWRIWMFWYLVNTQELIVVML